MSFRPSVRSPSVRPSMGLSAIPKGMVIVFSYMSKTRYSRISGRYIWRKFSLQTRPFPHI